MRASDDSHPRDRTLPRREPPAGSHQLALWRTERLPDIELSAIREVRRALAGGVCLHHRAWPAARRGEAAAAIAVALDLARRAEPDPAVVDLALSTVLVAAWRGDAAARTVLAHVLAGLPPDLRGGHPGRPGRRRPGRRPPPRR